MEINNRLRYYLNELPLSTSHLDLNDLRILVSLFSDPRLDIQRIIHSLPQPLRERPPIPLPLFHETLPEPARLCSSHIGLNNHIIQDIIHILDSIAEDLLPHVLQHLPPPTLLPLYLHETIKTVYEYLGARLSRKEYRFWFHSDPPSHFSRYRHAPECCLLLYIGVQTNLLTAFRSILLASFPLDSISVREREIDKLALLDVWICASSPGAASRNLLTSTITADALRRLRRDGTFDVVGSAQPSTAIRHAAPIVAMAAESAPKRAKSTSGSVGLALKYRLGRILRPISTVSNASSCAKSDVKRSSEFVSPAASICASLSSLASGDRRASFPGVAHAPMDEVLRA